MRVLIDDTFR